MAAELIRRKPPMAMDSKVVNTALRERVRPFLRDQGFTHFTSRSSWRFLKDRVEVINFQSFNAYNAEIMGTTTYSFAVNLGSYPKCVPEQQQLKEKKGEPLPEEYRCPLRGRLQRTFDQPESALKEVWFIDPAGQYLEPAVSDVIAQISDVAFPWFEPATPALGIGLSTHKPAEAQRALSAGADYIAIGPIYATSTKPAAKPATLEYVRWAAVNVTVPWFAIGGITLQNLDEVLAAGARRICVVSAILTAPDIAARCREFKTKLENIP